MNIKLNSNKKSQVLQKDKENEILKPIKSGERNKKLNNLKTQKNPTNTRNSPSKLKKPKFVKHYLCRTNRNTPIKKAKDCNSKMNINPDLIPDEDYFKKKRKMNGCCKIF